MPTTTNPAQGQPQALIVYCTCPEEAAAKLAEALVETKLAACVNAIPTIQSTYAWQGAIEQTSETLLLIKTHAEVYPALEQKLLDLHPYELPEIVAVSIERGLPAYLDWLRDNAAGQRR